MTNFRYRVSAGSFYLLVAPAHEIREPDKLQNLGHMKSSLIVQKAKIPLDVLASLMERKLFLALLIFQLKREKRNILATTF